MEHLGYPEPRYYREPASEQERQAVEEAYHTFDVRVFVPGVFSDEEKRQLNELLAGNQNAHIVAEGIIIRIDVEGFHPAQGDAKGQIRVSQKAARVKPKLAISDVKVLEVRDEEGKRVWPPLGRVIDLPWAPLALTDID